MADQWEIDTLAVINERRMGLSLHPLEWSSELESEARNYWTNPALCPNVINSCNCPHWTSTKKICDLLWNEHLENCVYKSAAIGIFNDSVSHCAVAVSQNVAKHFHKYRVIDEHGNALEVEAINKQAAIEEHNKVYGVEYHSPPLQGTIKEKIVDDMELDRGSDGSEHITDYGWHLIRYSALPNWVKRRIWRIRSCHYSSPDDVLVGKTFLYSYRVGTDDGGYIRRLRRRG